MRRQAINRFLKTFRKTGQRFAIGIAERAFADIHLHAESVIITAQRDIHQCAAGSFNAQAYLVISFGMKLGLGGNVGRRTGRLSGSLLHHRLRITAAVGSETLKQRRTESGKTRRIAGMAEVRCKL
ncbi:hypothetical protein SRABI106_04517 [Rahnella aquatilis]|nr:hypothetical protein SRABI106_04517 [Rahnella aquatilis]